MLFVIPFVGRAIGAGVGAPFGHLRDKGIDETPAASERCAAAGHLGAVHGDPACAPDKAIAVPERYRGTVIKTSLSDEDARCSKNRHSPLRSSAGEEATR